MKHVSEYIVADKSFNTVSYHVRKESPAVSAKLSAGNVNVRHLLRSNHLANPVVTIIRAIFADESLDSYAKGTGGSCLEASAVAALLMAIHPVKKDTEYYHEPKIIGWNGRKRGPLRAAYRSLLHDHYAVVYHDRDDEVMFMTHDGVVISLKDIVAFKESGDWIKERILRKVVGIDADKEVDKNDWRIMRAFESIADSYLASSAEAITSEQ